jgi:PAS domain S-box-containing protein
MAFRWNKEKSFPQGYKQYEDIVEFSPLAICVQVNNNIVFLNNAGTKLLNQRNVKHLIGKSVTDFVSPRYRETVMERLQWAQTNETEIVSFEADIIRPDGTKVDVEISATPLTYQNKQAIQIVFHEITNRKHMENLIFQCQHDWEDTFQNITDMITVHDKDFNIIRANKAAEEILKLPSLERVLNMKCFSYYHGTNGPPEGCPSCDCLTTGKPCSFEVFEPHLGMHIEIRAMPRFDKNNHLAGLIHIVRDVTQRKLAEKEIQTAKNELESRVEQRTLELKATNEQLLNKIADHKRAQDNVRKSESKFRSLSQEFHTLLDGIPDSLILLSPDLKIKWANKSAYSTFVKTVSELTEQDCYKLCCDIVSPCEKCPTLRSFQTGKEENSEYVNSKGRVWDLRAFPIVDDTGKVKNVIELKRDITEKINLQAEAMRTRHLASLGELAAGVAHEINNPINNIINYAQILIDEKKGDDGIEHRIIKDGERIAIIVRSLLSFARIRKEEKENTHLKAILSDMLSLTGAQIRKDGITLKLDIPSDLPQINVHAQQIQQVFLNIISNSRFVLNTKYPGTHKNKVIQISCKKITIDNSPYVRIMFHDRGTGIPAHIMNKVLNPFFSTKPFSMGTGLGLSISHGIISEHNGKFMIESTEGKFTNITIDLPSKA